jgi:hypothetical protein
MSFAESITGLVQRIPTLIDHLETEEATKNALVMPFIAALGYDVFNPQEVTPELNADVGVKKGEKVDYAIKRDGEVIMLFECKSAGTNLSHANMSQLFRYFSVTKARIGILTNGTEYRFFSDLEEPNKMDQRPFLVLDLLGLREDHLAEVKKLTKESFDLERMLSAASDLKYLREIMAVLNDQLEEPDPDLVRFFYSKAVPNGRFTSTAREQFTPLVARALQQLIRERVSDRLRSALEREDVPAVPPASEAEQETESGQEDAGVETTEEEIEGFHIVKAICREVVNADRIVHRDTKSYMGILLDDNNRQPICRLRFNYSTKYLGTFDEDKNETKHPLETLDDIYQHADALKRAAQQYD